MQDRPPTRLHVEFSLEFLIARSQIKAGGPMRRLNAIENLLMLLTPKWRLDAPIRPLEELRMCAETRDHLVGWITAGGDVDDRTKERLAPYVGNELIVEAVPPGLLRVLLLR